MYLIQGNFFPPRRAHTTQPGAQPSGLCHRGRRWLLDPTAVTCEFPAKRGSRNLSGSRGNERHGDCPFPATGYHVLCACVPALSLLTSMFLCMWMCLCVCRGGQRSKGQTATGRQCTGGALKEIFTAPAAVRDSGEFHPTAASMRAIFSTKRGGARVARDAGGVHHWASEIPPASISRCTRRWKLACCVKIISTFAREETYLGIPPDTMIQQIMAFPP